MKTILVAVDDEVVSLLLRDELFEEGYWVKTVSDLSMLRQVFGDSRPDLLIIDELFGKGRSLELCWELRSLFKGTQVILWLNCPSLLRKDAKWLPVDVHISKTYDLQVLKRETVVRLEQGTPVNSTTSPCGAAEFSCTHAQVGFPLRHG